MKKADLFDLIHSLTKAEKRYFKLYASLQSGEKKYLLLFDGIEKQKEDNEDELRSLFKKEKFVKQIHVAKNYLYNLLLKSLNVNHLESSIDSTLKNLINTSEILYNKGLNKQSLSILEKAHDAAGEYEDFITILDILNRKHKLADTGEERNKLLHAETETLKKLNAFGQISLLESRCRFLINIPRSARNKHQNNELKQLIKDPLLNVTNKYVSFRVTTSQYNTWSFYYGSIGNMSKSILYSKKLVDLMEDSPKQMEKNPWLYIKYLTNLMIDLAASNKTEDFFTVSQKLRSLITNTKIIRSDSHRMAIFVKVYSDELIVNARLKRYDEALKLLPEIQSGLELYDPIIPLSSKLIFYYNIAELHFETKQFKQALKWINKIIHQNFHDEREDIQSFSRILNIMIHYELGNDETIEYAIRSTYRFLLKRDHLYKFELIILKFIRKLPQLRSDNLVGFYEQLRDALKKALINTFEASSLNYSDFISWIDEKIGELESKKKR